VQSQCEPHLDIVKSFPSFKDLTTSHQLVNQTQGKRKAGVGRCKNRIDSKGLAHEVEKIAILLVAEGKSEWNGHGERK
jgi:hypothetical protein